MGVEPRLEKVISSKISLEDFDYWKNSQGNTFLKTKLSNQLSHTS